METRSDDGSRPGREDDRGSALVMAIFVLAVLTGMGVTLLFLSQNEVRMSQANLRASSSFYLAEAGLEEGRAALYDRNKGGEFDDDLVYFAGTTDTDINFDPANLQVVWDGDGNPTGFTGFDDDIPVTVSEAPQTFGGGLYAVFLTNDPIDGVTNQADTNDLVMLTAVGAGPRHSVEVVQAIIERREIFPSFPPSTITILGPNPNFVGGNSNAKQYVGDDCALTGGGIPGLYVPTVGTVGSAITSGVVKPGSYDSGGDTGYDTVADVVDQAGLTAGGYGMPALTPEWTDCSDLRDFVEGVRLASDVICYPPAACAFPAVAPDNVIFIDGDYTMDGSGTGEGMLLITGSFNMHGQAEWSGMIFVIGEGQFERDGAGNGGISGAMMIADIAGPDNVYGTSDDCTGGTDGFDQGTFDEDGGGTGDTQYCTDDITPANPVYPYKILEFRQR